jgi:hypothetical protein
MAPRRSEQNPRLSETIFRTETLNSPLQLLRDVRIISGTVTPLKHRHRALCVGLSDHVGEPRDFGLFVGARVPVIGSAIEHDETFVVNETVAAPCVPEPLSELFN